MTQETSTLAVQAGELLVAQDASVCTAESCTGGLIASLLTDVSGSSRYVRGGIVAYENAIKEALLGVKTQTLIDYGAVSEQTAVEMAQGARETLDTDYALSVTGIAGPGGGTDTKPVGLTFIGLASRSGDAVVRRFVWDGNRLQNKRASADAALQLLIDHLS
jgi:PncC family amidohydrolase